MRSHILAGASALAILTSPAFAGEDQTTTAAGGAAEEEAAIETMVVTGSRIARLNIESTVPVTSLSAAELLQNGQVNVGDRLALLPQFRPTFTSQNSGRFIGTAGISILDLRGQGTARTLVLQNGLRHVTSQPGANTVDVSTIPVDLIERVDIVTGGNSSIYGSDAVAGVVNFVMKQDFQGLMGRAQAGTSSRGDSNQYIVTLTAGTNFGGGRGNIAVSLEYNKSDPLFFADREYTGAVTGRPQFNLVDDTTGEPAAGDGIIDNQFFTGVKNLLISTGGAYASTCPTTPGARATLNCSGVFQGTSQFGNVFMFQPDGTLVRNVVSTDFRPFNSNNGIGGLGSTLRETGLMQIGNTRYAANMIGHYDVADAFRPYFEAKFVRTESLQEGQPTFSSGALNPNFSINNPFLTAQARDLLVTSLAPGATTFQTTRFNIDFGGRGENHSREVYRIVVGARGNFLDTWNYNVAFNYGRAETYYETRGNVHLQRFTNAVNAVRQDPANASSPIVCAINADTNTANDDPACRPLNLFGLGAPSAAALAYIEHVSSRRQWSEQFNVIANVAGDLGKLFELPGGPVAFSLGGEWRQERSFSAFDAVTKTPPAQTFLNTIADFTPPKQDIYEAFAEIRIPLLKDMPFFKEFTIEAATRVSNYSVGNTGTVWSYNAGAMWRPFNDLRLRANYGRATRAPTPNDLFSAQSQTFLNGLVDPCGQQNINANPNRVANCAAAGVPTTQTFNGVTLPFRNIPASGISGLSGGNPFLFAEKSDSVTLGAVFEPSFLPGFTMTLDWYRISLSDAINTVAAQTVINQCYDDPGGINNGFCAAVFRNPNGTFRGQSNVSHDGQTVNFATTGQSFITGPFNYARQVTSGIDLDASYTHKFGEDWRLNVRATLSWLGQRNIFTSITEPNRLTRERSTLGNPDWNGQANITVGYKGFDLLYSFRYLSKQTIGTWRAQNVEQGRLPENLDQFPQVYYPAITYSDVRFTAKVYKDISLYAGVDNIFDQLPPLDLVLGDGAGSAIYTNTGRFFYGGVSVKF